MARAEDAAADRVECDELGFAFALIQDADEADCYRVHQSGPDGSSAVYEQMIVYHGPEVIHVAKAGAGRDTYFSMRSLRGYIERFDEFRELGSWSGDTNYADFQVARFDAKMVDQPVGCFAFLRVGARVFVQHGSMSGPGSFMVGYDCQLGTGAPARSLIEHTLSQIE